MFETNTITVDMGNNEFGEERGGHIEPKNVEMMIINGIPLIIDWDYQTPYNCTNLNSNVNFLQNLIVKQDKSIDTLKKKITQLTNELTTLKNVCYSVYKFTYLV